jgi:hypothetical protein
VSGVAQAKQCILLQGKDDVSMTLVRKVVGGGSSTDAAVAVGE